MLYASDSEIGLSWVLYEKTRLNVFQRLRVANIRNKLIINNLFHVDGKENIADCGTRPDLLSVEQLSPGSDWLCGKAWMRESVEYALEKGIIKSTRDIILDNEKKKVFKQGIINDFFDSNLIEDYYVNTIDVKKVVEITISSNYLFDPLKRSFRPTVRIYALVILATKRWKKKWLLTKFKKGQVTKSDLMKTNFSPVKFQVFSSHEKSDEPENYTSVYYLPAQLDFTSVYPINNASKGDEKNSLLATYNVKSDCNKTTVVQLSDEASSAALEYLFKKSSNEYINICGNKAAKKNGVIHDGVLYSKSRLLEEQEIRAVGHLENIDIKSFTGVGFRVPLIHRNSPLAISIANHIHYNVCRHKGVETTYRLSLQHIAIQLTS